jgi:hypothetical protein
MLQKKVLNGRVSAYKSSENAVSVSSPGCLKCHDNEQIVKTSCTGSSLLSSTVVAPGVGKGRGAGEESTAGGAWHMHKMSQKYIGGTVPRTTEEATKRATRHELQGRAARWP